MQRKASKPPLRVPVLTCPPVFPQAELVFAEVLDTLRVIGERLCGQAGRTTTPEARRCIVELEALLVKEKAAFEEHLFEISKDATTWGAAERHPGEPIADVLELNRLRRELAIGSFQWDSRLHYLASSLKLRKPTRMEGTSLLDDPALFPASRGTSPPPVEHTEPAAGGGKGKEKIGEEGAGGGKQQQADVASGGAVQGEACTSKPEAGAPCVKDSQEGGVEKSPSVEGKMEKSPSVSSEKPGAVVDGAAHVESSGPVHAQVRQIPGGEHVLESFVQGSILGDLQPQPLSDEKAKALVEKRIVEQDRRDSLLAGAPPAHEDSSTGAAAGLDLVARAGAVVERFLAGHSLSGEGKGEELADLRAEEDLVAASAASQAQQGSDLLASPTAQRPLPGWDLMQVEKMVTKQGGGSSEAQAGGAAESGGLVGDMDVADAGMYRTSSAGPTASWPHPGGAPGPEQQSPDPLQSADIGVRRVLSEGHLPILADLSATLDAAWTGEDPRAMPAVVAALAERQSAEVTLPPQGSDASEHQAESSGQGLFSFLGAAVHYRSGSESPDTGSAAPSAPTSPSRRNEEAREEERSGWAFSTLYRAMAPISPPRDSGSNSQGGNMPSVVSHAAQVAAQGGARIMLPVGHDDMVVAVYDDEPSSVIAYALCSEEYQAQLKVAASAPTSSRQETSVPPMPGGGEYATGDAQEKVGSGEEVEGGGEKKLGSGEEEKGEGDGALLETKQVHIDTMFMDDAPQGRVRFMVKVYYAPQFEALRR
jgi:hypothetical protein